ncbi:hypothetical protein SEA_PHRAPPUCCINO_80 [Mycobacterium phage Phrappuccino]|uniref:Uncharacterized protein n=1 Tax=Mycobacterium phage Phrappuccino TaxID=2591223 RepID=A0A514DDS3_9CAUD|nr:hypothetical protein KHQ87_gp080 [Mycobacterium phage Phrappuccino]QDH91755.1 hypothetical protein SEA_PHRAPPUCCINO_80 [Mycobacterium phage Phrappuccino]QIQ63197.1 hypothetical protein SEA_SETTECANDELA_80 [Mycobacterium phage Settecandela]
MADFASNCPVSWPIKIPNLLPEIDLNGVMFSYQHGLVYNADDPPSQLRQPVEE